MNNVRNIFRFSDPPLLSAFHATYQYCSFTQGASIKYVGKFLGIQTPLSAFSVLFVHEIGRFSIPLLTADVQGGQSASGKKYLDSKSEVTFCYVYPVTQANDGTLNNCQHISFTKQMGHPVLNGSHKIRHPLPSARTSFMNAPISRNGLPTSRSGVRLNELELSSGSILDKARAAFVAKLAKGEVPDPTPEPEEDEVQCRVNILLGKNLQEVPKCKSRGGFS